MGSKVSQIIDESSESIRNNNNSSIPISSFPQRQNYLLDDDENYELFTIVWLDQISNTNSLDSLRTKTLLKQINNNDNCFFYNDINLFLDDINEKIKFENKILLVVSGSFAERILSISTKLDATISTIIIFCNDSTKYKKYLNKYNVTDICSDHDSLKNSIQRELPSLKFNLFENQPFKTTRLLTTKSFSSSIQDYNNTSAFFSYILFIELLKKIPQNEQAKQIMLNKCKDYYRRDKNELEKIEKFRQNYSSSNAIDWYTRDSFIYKLVNKAFRTEDTALWYLFRFFIVDLCTQIEQVHQAQQIKNSYTVYRGQARMTNKEFDNIKSNIGSLISTNGFLSTSKSLDIALQFIAGATDCQDFKVVLFQIEIPSDKIQNTIFVDVEQYLNGTDEKEILFNIGSVFIIENVERDEQRNFWRIQMSATDQGTFEIKQRIDFIIKEFQSFNINLLFGRLLIDMHQYVKAEAYFRMILQELPNDHQDLPSIHDYIGNINMCTSNYEKSMISFNIAYDLKCKRFPSNHPELAVTLNNFGNYYKAIGNMNKALKYYNKALKCQNDPLNNAITILNIGTMHMKNGHYRQAEDFCLQSRDSLQQIEPCPYAEIIVCQGILGEILFLQQAYIEAENFYLTAFELSKKHLYIGHIHLIHSIEALADLYEKLDGNNKRALKFCFEQLSMHKEYLFDENHVSIAFIQMKIGQLLNDKSYYEKALTIFEKNLHQHYESTSNCLIILAKFYQNEQALSLYSKANEIQRKIYPSKHSSILNSQQMINNLTKYKTHLPIKKINLQNHSLNVDLQQLSESQIDDNVLSPSNTFIDEFSSDENKFVGHFQTFDSDHNEKNAHTNLIEENFMEKDEFKEQKSKVIDIKHNPISCNRFLEKTNVINEDIILSRFEKFK
ncbi:unnamed protein product [Rotaria sp. Silwood1]|nr:unnamed protein product [Rotaria sp. Silwood1]CAF1648256.1 unnamed protein product [Rotaria sp. Silwood1]CAF3834122.1 unnamed protein product [Rotaria sp. Silwood1]